MTRSKRIQTIVKLKQHKERDAARQLAAAQSTLAGIHQRLQQMLTYKEEYLQLFKPKDRALSVNMLREQQAFILQIDQGIKLLREQLRIQEKMNEQERQNWLSQKQQLDTMQNIYESCHQAEQQLAELRAQHGLDELATARAARHS